MFSVVLSAALVTAGISLVGTLFFLESEQPYALIAIINAATPILIFLFIVLTSLMQNKQMKLRRDLTTYFEQLNSAFDVE